MKPHSEYNKDKRGFLAKEQGGGSGWKNTKRKHQGWGILPEARPGRDDVTSGNEEFH